MTDTKRRRRRRPVTVEAEANTVPAVKRDQMPAQAPQTSIDDQIATKMAESHPIYGAFGHVFREIGGVEALADWAAEEPGKFYAIFSKMVPKESGQNQINIQINAKLAPGPLDE